tara:strand:+ start:870 stop:1769 length:900 start_codon:yes stop_codon:yes gene_type:complete
MNNKSPLLQNLKFNYQLGKKTWFGTGGNCNLFLEVNSIDQLINTIKIAKRFVPIFVIGSGSNVIIRDGGFKGIVIKLGVNFRKIKINNDNSILSIGAGTRDSEVSKFCVENNISGLEFLSGIPGTIGGNIKMNAGCYGDQISDKLIDCTIIDERLKKKILKKSEIDFCYRKSSFDNKHVIIEARFKIQKDNKFRIKKKISIISDKRKKSQPVASRTGGSTFKNSSSYPAWKLIDEIDYRGKKLGGAKVSALHSNFLINYNNATSLDLEILGEEIKNKVWEKRKINLKWELIRIGEFKKV